MKHMVNEDSAFDEKYSIDTFGNLVNLKTGKFLKFRKDKDGYLVCNLRINGKRVTRFQHRLLAIKYLANPENKTQVNHINGIKHDNSLHNLEWSTRSENMLHSTHVLGNPKPPSNKGNTGVKSPLSRHIVGISVLDDTCLIFAGQKDAQRQTNSHFKQSNIYTSIKTGCSHKGYIWSFLEEVEDNV